VDAPEFDPPAWPVEPAFGEEDACWSVELPAGVAPTPAGRSTNAWSPPVTSCEAPIPSAPSAQTAVTTRIVSAARFRLRVSRRLLRFCRGSDWAGAFISVTPPDAGRRRLDL